MVVVGRICPKAPVSSSGPCGCGAGLRSAISCLVQLGRPERRALTGAGWRVQGGSLRWGRTGEAEHAQPASAPAWSRTDAGPDSARGLQAEHADCTEPGRRDMWL